MSSLLVFWFKKCIDCPLPSYLPFRKFEYHSDGVLEMEYTPWNKVFLLEHTLFVQSSSISILEGFRFSIW